MLKLVQHKPKINTTDFNGLVYCNLRAERVTTVLLHLRRLKSEEELAKVAAKVWKRIPAAERACTKLGRQGHRAKR